MIVGSKVGDDIYAGAGNDVIRGGSGADVMSGGSGNDTFVFGANEAAPEEYFYANDDGPNDADRMLVLGDNDFTEVGFSGIEVLAFGGKATATFNQYIVGSDSPMQTVQGDGNANTLAIKVINYGYGPPAVDLSELAFKSWSAADKVTITGSNAADAIAGSAVGDVIDGGLGSDDLQGNAGADTFVFSLKTRGVDHVADFLRKEGDKIGLDGDSFPTLKPGVLRKKAFEIGDEADSRKDRIIYDKKDGTVRYDDDGSGKHKAVIIGVLDDAAKLKAGDILVL
jgi:Ca2+-binding RTX toxin-like protein